VPPIQSSNRGELDWLRVEVRWVEDDKETGRLELDMEVDPQ
jgi:hypothetical protein